MHFSIQTSLFSFISLSCTVQTGNREEKKDNRERYKGGGGLEGEGGDNFEECLYGRRLSKQIQDCTKFRQYAIVATVEDSRSEVSQKVTREKRQYTQNGANSIYNLFA